MTDPDARPATALRRWFAPPVPGVVASVGLLVLHVGGGLYAIDTIRDAWGWRRYFGLVADNILTGWFNLGPGLKPWLGGFALGVLGAVVLLAAVTAGRIAWRLWRRQPDPHVGLRIRAAVYAALICVLFNAFILSTPETASGPFRVRLPLLSSISVALAYGGYALWSLLLPRLQRVFSARLRRVVDVAFANAAVILVLVEVTLRIVASLRPSPLLVSASAAPEVRRGANRGRPGQVRYNFPLNQGGHNDVEFLPPSPARGPVVLTIGDSYSYGSVPHAFHFTTVAERAVPGLQIYNMGYSDIGPSDYRHLLQQEALPLKPELIVVNLFMGNDVTATRSMPGPTHWYDADNYLIAVVWNRLRIMKRAEVARSPEAVAQANLTPAELARQYPWLTDPTLEKPLFSREVYVEVEARYASLIARTPVIPAFGNFFQELAAMEQAAGDTPLAFMLIPAAFQVEDDRWDEIVKQSPIPLDRDVAQRVTVEWLECRGRPVLDLLPVLRAVPPMADGRRHLYHLNDTHFNARGNEFAGRALGWFVDSLVSRKPGAAPRCRRPPPPPPAPPPRIALPFRVDIGDSTARRWMTSGWNADEGPAGQSYAWSEGRRSVLAVPLPGESDIRMDFTVLPLVFQGSPTQRISVMLNGRPVGEVTLRPDMQTYSLTLPAAALGAPWDTLRFDYAYARTPQELGSSQDKRALGVAWYAIDFTARNP